jgi:pimeloyl-[acyl-carrier protein] methyl ester esterase
MSGALELMQLHTETFGEGIDLVLIHGWGMNSAVWSPLVEPLSQHYRLTLIDMPGHGHSEYDPECTDLDQWVDAVAQVAPESATWIGWSLGGMLAQRAAARFPGRVQGLVSIAASPRFSQSDNWPHAMALDTLLGFATDLREDHNKTMDRFLLLQAHGDAEVRKLLSPLRKGLGSRPEPDDRALETGLDLLLNVDLRSDLAEIQCPTMWMLGRRDRLVPVAVADDLPGLLPESQVHIFGHAAHLPMLSDQVLCLKLLQGFING